MTDLRPVAFSWQEIDVCLDGGEVRRALVMLPLPRFLPLCKRQYVVGEEYGLGPVEEISNNSRGGFFKAVREAWNSLPEDDTRFPTKECLRKRALVAAGWARHKQIIMDTPKDARRLGLEARGLDEYAVIVVKENVVDIWIARSIAAGQITKDQWKDVKPRALDYVSQQCGTTRTELEQHSADGGAR